MDLPRRSQSLHDAPIEIWRASGSQHRTSLLVLAFVEITPKPASLGDRLAGDIGEVWVLVFFGFGEICIFLL
jgi:hypothetical protein